MTSNKLLVLLFAALVACNGGTDKTTTDVTFTDTPDNADIDTDTDADSDADSDIDADSDADSDADTDTSDTYSGGGSALRRPTDRGWRLVVPEDDEILDPTAPAATPIDGDNRENRFGHIGTPGR